MTRPLSASVRNFIPVTRAAPALMLIKQRERGRGQAECEQTKAEGRTLRFCPKNGRDQVLILVILVGSKVRFSAVS